MKNQSSFSMRECRPESRNMVLSLSIFCRRIASSCASRILILSPKLPSAVKTPMPASMTRRHPQRFFLHIFHCEAVTQVQILTGASSASGTGFILHLCPAWLRIFYKKWLLSAALIATSPTSIVKVFFGHIKPFTASGA